MASKKVKKKKDKIIKEARKTIKSAGTGSERKAKVKKKKDKVLKWADKTIKGSKLAKSVRKGK